MAATRRVKVVGHRGAAGIEPENTLRSFRNAIDLAVDLICTDRPDVLIQTLGRMQVARGGTLWPPEATPACLVFPWLRDMVAPPSGRMGGGQRPWRHLTTSPV